MSVIKVRCTDQVLKIMEAPVVASGGKNEVKVEFDFCEKWDGYAKTAIFYRDINDPYYAILNNKDTCVVPWEVCYEDGNFYFTVFGNKGDTRRTSTTVKYKVKKGVILEDLMPSDPTPDVYDQIMAMMADLDNEAETGRMIRYYRGSDYGKPYTYRCAEENVYFSTGGTENDQVNLVENEVYRVAVWLSSADEHRSYFCTAHPLPDGSGMYLGNPNWVDGIEADANYPFGIVVKPTTVATVAYIAQPYDVEVFKAVSNIDATLKKEKLAADAKATGEAIADAEARVAEAIETAKKEVGVLRINQSGSLDENSVEDIFQHEGPAYMNLLNSDRYASTVDVSMYDPYLLEYVKATNSLVDHNVILDPETNRRKVERTVIKLFELASGLTEEGKAADAKVVGEAIAQAKNEAGTALNAKVDKSGWSAGKFLGTDASGNVVAVDAPESNEAVSDEHIEEVIAGYLADNPVGSKVELDATLSQSGKAADAGAVGAAIQQATEGVNNAFTQVYQEINNLDLAGKTVGGVALETYIGNAVNSYIEEALGGEF